MIFKGANHRKMTTRSADQNAFKWSPCLRPKFSRPSWTRDISQDSNVEAVTRLMQLIA